MGLLTSLQGDRIYLDTNIWIYALEGFPTFFQELTALFQSIDQGNLQAITSELTLAEVLVKPIQNGNSIQQDTYKQAITSNSHLLVIPIQRELLINAAQLRVTTNLKLPDAIHAATALATQCSTFLTNDLKFQNVSGLQIVVLSQVIFP
ncbi:MAG: PIN domain-containing protein [Tildeniella nuda ZEHNDER 1965/U140]|jgi:predicted nucleic acid-binding protein|nr:PIN domain-containing protein [Tildeniella nuda ZEHNDER 1965/U140]